jgi:hypothetical protein
MNDDREVRDALTALLACAPQVALSSSTVLRAGRIRRRVRRTLIALGVVALTAMPTTGYARHEGLLTPGSRIVTPPEPRLDLERGCFDGPDRTLWTSEYEAVVDNLRQLVTRTTGGRVATRDVLTIRQSAITFSGCDTGKPIRTAYLELAPADKAASIRLIRITMQLYTDPAPGTWRPGHGPNPWPDTIPYGYSGGGDDVDFAGAFGRYCALTIQVAGSGLNAPYPFEDLPRFVRDPRILATAYMLQH